jgi:hypothetical protein
MDFVLYKMPQRERSGLREAERSLAARRLPEKGSTGQNHAGVVSYREKD